MRKQKASMILISQLTHCIHGFGNGSYYRTRPYRQLKTILALSKTEKIDDAVEIAEQMLVSVQASDSLVPNEDYCSRTPYNYIICKPWRREQQNILRMQTTAAFITAYFERNLQHSIKLYARGVFTNIKYSTMMDRFTGRGVDIVSQAMLFDLEQRARSISTVLSPSSHAWDNSISRALFAKVQGKQNDGSQNHVIEPSSSTLAAIFLSRRLGLPKEVLFGNQSWRTIAPQKIQFLSLSSETAMPAMRSEKNGDADMEVINVSDVSNSCGNFPSWFRKETHHTTLISSSLKKNRTERLVNKRSASLPTIDVMLPVHTKDRSIASVAVRLLLRHCRNPIGTIWVISQDEVTAQEIAATQWPPLPMKSTFHADNTDVAWVPETAYPFRPGNRAADVLQSVADDNISTFTKLDACSLSPSFPDHRIYLQLLKLLFPLVVPGARDKILAMDADVLWLRDITFVDKQGRALHGSGGLLDGAGAGAVWSRAEGGRGLPEFVAALLGTVRPFYWNIANAAKSGLPAELQRSQIEPKEIVDDFKIWRDQSASRKRDGDGSDNAIGDDLAQISSPMHALTHHMILDRETVKALYSHVATRVHSTCGAKEGSNVWSSKIEAKEKNQYELMSLKPCPDSGWSAWMIFVEVFAAHHTPRENFQTVQSTLLSKEKSIYDRDSALENEKEYHSAGSSNIWNNNISLKHTSIASVHEASEYELYHVYAFEFWEHKFSRRIGDKKEVHKSARPRQPQLQILDWADIGICCFFSNGSPIHGCNLDGFDVQIASNLLNISSSFDLTHDTTGLLDELAESYGLDFVACHDVLRPPYNKMHEQHYRALIEG